MSPPGPPARAPHTLLLFLYLLTGFPFTLASEWNSLEATSPDADLIRDAPLYPTLQHDLPNSSETNPDISDGEVSYYEKDNNELNDVRQAVNDNYNDAKYNDVIDNSDAIIHSTYYDEANQDYNIGHIELSEDDPNAIDERNVRVESNKDYNDITYTSVSEDVGDPDIKDVEKDLSGSNIGEDADLRDETEAATKVQNEDDVRNKRSSDYERASKSVTERRVKTGDTILNIRGAVRDAIGDAGAAPGPRASSRLDTFVIRPAQAQHQPRTNTQQPRTQPQIQHPPKYERELLVEAHTRARLECEIASENSTNVKWYKDGEEVRAGEGGGEVWREGAALVVGRATRGDAATWRCTKNDGTGTVSSKPIKLLIYEAVRAVYLAVDGRRLDAGNTWVPVRDKTELEVRCVAEGGVPPPELSWRLLALEPALDHRPYLRVHHTNYSIEGVSVSQAVVTAARELHNATLQCAAKQRTPPPRAAHALTAKLEIHVTYPPSFVISRWPGFGVSLSAGGAAALRCDVDANPPARAWWLRDDDNPTSSPPPLEAGDESARGSATLRWAALRGSHAGWYRCRATWLDTEYSSIGYYLNVISHDESSVPVTEAQPEPEEPDHQKVEVPLGGNVQLHCPKGSVGCWWRRVVGNSSESWAPAGSHHAHGVLGIKEALYQEGGEYRCVGARAPDLAALRELKRVTLRVTGGATATALSAMPVAGGWRLECGACGRELRVVWVRARRAAPADLAPDLAQHCWRAVLHVAEPDEVWCVAAAAGGAGAVAVFPRRSPPAPPASPAPARHTVRALHNTAHTLHTTPPLILLLIVTLR